MILKIHIFISVLMIVCFLLCCVSAKRRLDKELCEKIKKQESSIADSILTYIKLLLFGFIPVINIVFLYVSTVKSEWFIEEICKETRKKYE